MTSSAAGVYRQRVANPAFRRDHGTQATSEYGEPHEA